ncbi:hypothetical protein AKJ09_02572 [Labilithrix luteola]|uniref:Uncharacterized protein n=2 Tax=Labilithrix luteola TaxID=1391654 RepID=A0A0K1PQV2_9BACT|nr:hypothetical protein AKJ09_02572 [Labilithrix luteola]
MPTTGGADASNATGSSQGPSKTFQVERTSGQAPAERAGNVEGASGASPLERLRAGEIDVHGYIDLKVDQATAGLSGLSPSELAHIKNTLRDQMASDPGLADLVRAATGQTPKLPEED